MILKYKLETFLKDLFKQFKLENPELNNEFKEHAQLLKISFIENTGVGCYINFEYNKIPNILFKDKEIIGLKQILYINNIEEPFFVEINLENDKIKFVEIVSSSEVDWDGNFDKWRFKFNI